MPAISFLRVAFLICLSLVVVIPQPALATTAWIDATTSFVVFESPDVELLLPQAPGSLETTLNGTLVFEISGDTISFPGGSLIVLGIHPGPFFPDTPHVNLAGQAYNEQSGITVYATYANATTDLVKETIPLNPDGTFSTDGIRVLPLSGTYNVDSVPPFIAQSIPLQSALSFGNLTGSVTPLGGNKYEILIPFRVRGVSSPLSGQIRAVVPEPASWLMAAMGAAGLMGLAWSRRR